jgi:hypothetical protein
MLELILCLTLLNTFLLVAVAGSVAKVVKHLSEKGALEPIQKASSRERRQLTYADTYLLPQPQEMEDNRPRNWDGIPRDRRNWDGIPQEEE